MTPPEKTDALELTQFPLDEQDAAALGPLYQRFKSFWADASEEPRAKFHRFIGATPSADGALFRPTDTPELPGIWCEPPSAAAERAILYLHGGAYTLGSADTYRGFVSQIAARAQARAFILDYPLAPETTAPVALELAREALDSLLARHRHVAVVGDSAGGGLALATVAGAARAPSTLAAEHTVGRVAAAVVFSPWTDLTLSGRSFEEKASSDVLLEPALLADAARGYIGNLAADDPRVSPLFGIPRGLPPLLIQAGTEELLLDDSRRYARAASGAGAAVRLELWQGLHHVFQLDVETLASARRALDRAAAFLSSAWLG